MRSRAARAARSVRAASSASERAWISGSSALTRSTMRLESADLALVGVPQAGQELQHRGAEYSPMRPRVRSEGQGPGEPYNRSAMEIAPGVHQVRMLGADSFVVAEERLTLIDAGMLGSRRALERQLQRLGRSLDEMARIICTHGHPDHIGGVHELIRDRDDVEVLIHPADLARAPAAAARRARRLRGRGRAARPADPVSDPSAGELHADRGRGAAAGARWAAGGSHARPHAGQRVPLRRAASAALHRRRAPGHPRPSHLCQRALQPRPRGRARICRAAGVARGRHDRPLPLSTLDRRRQRRAPRARGGGGELTAVRPQWRTAEDEHMETVNELVGRSVQGFGSSAGADHQARLPHARLALSRSRAAGAEDRPCAVRMPARRAATAW